MIENLIDFYGEFKKAVEDLAQKRAEQLIEEKPEDYNPQVVDCGYYNNGVGFACYGKETEYNEDQARIDALEEIAEDLANGGQDLESYYSLFAENNKITSLLAKLVQDME